MFYHSRSPSLFLVFVSGKPKLLSIIIIVDFKLYLQSEEFHSFQSVSRQLKLLCKARHSFLWL